MSYKKSVNKWLLIYILLIFVVIMAYIAGNRTIGIDKDSLMYASFVNESINGINVSFLSKEPGFWFILFMNNVINGDTKSFFIIYALFALILKVYGIWRVSPNFLTSLILYIGFYFLLHEMMQIRIGLASGFLFLTYLYLCLNNKKKAFLYSFLGVLFHYSTIISFIFFFLKPEKKLGKIYLLLPLFGILIGYLIENNYFIIEFLFNQMPAFISHKASLYFLIKQQGILDDVKPIVIGFGTFIYYFLLVFMYFRLKARNIKVMYERALNLLLKITSIQLFLAFVLMFNIEFSNRIYSYIGVLTFTILPAFFLKEFPKKYQILLFLLIFSYSLRQLYTNYVGIF